MIILHNMIYLILESYAKLNSRLEIPHTNYVVQCNTLPNNSTIANTYMYDPF